MKIYIVGSVASGKSTLARKISHITGAPCYHLDEAVYTVDPSEPWGNKKRPLEERDRLFQAMLAQRHYIMEDAGRDCFRAGMEQADTVLLLEIPRIVREKAHPPALGQAKPGPGKVYLPPSLCHAPSHVPLGPELRHRGGWDKSAGVAVCKQDHCAAQW